MTWRRPLSLAAFSLAASLAVRPAAAQLAPTGGHYANQPSDTGFAGSVNSSGGYAASVPLDLPTARGGLPVPVSIVYSERGVGAAGLGWDVPLSYIVRDMTVAHRRPMPTANGDWQAREAVSLVLEGRHIDLVPTASGWVARRDAPDLLVRAQNNGTWLMFDGQGRTYSFTVSALTGPISMWLLKDITGVGGSKVELAYSITAPSVPGGSGLAIDLTGVSYNPSPTTANCYKHSVGLVYDADATTPLSLSVLGDRLLVRKHKLTTVNVNSKGACGDAYVRLRGYQLAYTADIDTQQPRLQSVTLVGREGTPEAASPIPLGTYTYGAATNAGRLRYESTSERAGNTFVEPHTQLTVIVGTPTGTPDLTFSTWASLIDLTGDGLPDSVATILPVLKIVIDWLNSAPSVSIQDGLFPNALEKRGLTQERYRSKVNDDLVWRQVIDVNGDGRMDVIDAAEVVGQWVIYLNVPDLSKPTTIRWVRRSYSTQALANLLMARGLPVDPNHVPLARHSTVAKVNTNHCWSWDVIGQRWRHFLCGTTRTEATFTEWEVSDVNGDGYPDVVFNSSPIVFENFDPGTPDPPPNPEEFSTVTTISTSTPVLAASNQIHTVFNLLGVHVGLGSQPYGNAALLRSSDPCGVAQWREVSSSRQQLECAVIDVNGDGIADRVSGTSVYLGTGVFGMSGFFTTSAALTLPGSLSIQNSDRATICEAPGAQPTTPFRTRLLAGLRDLTGDGLPDYVSLDVSGNWQVAIGTGTRFLAPIPIPSNFELSLQNDQCGGVRSTTIAGVYDIDGDGKADVLGQDGFVRKLRGSLDVFGAPEAGRLVQIDNGFGASTIVTYRSAKRLAAPSALTELHQIPFPEVVVSSVETTRTGNAGTTLLAKTQYAYGGAQLVFDPAQDAFRFPGYRRHVALRLPLEHPPDQPAGQPGGMATITDAYVPSNTTDPYDLAAGPLTTDQRYARLLRLGRVSDVTVLAGSVGTNPAALLSVNVGTDSRRIASTHYEWDAKPLPAASNAPEICSEMVFPYDHPASVAFSSTDACRQRGFAFATSVQTLRSMPGAAVSSTAKVTTRSDVLTMDTFGRATSVKQFGDLARNDDDLCIDTVFAQPAGTNERVLSAVSSRTVTDCGTTVYAKDSWRYDERDLGSVSAGLPTAHDVERRDDTGALLATLRTFDAQFSSEGNPTVVTTRRDVNASRTVTTAYDPFGLVPIIVLTTATDLPPQRIDLVRDPLSLNVTTSREPNSTEYGTTFDGFDRAVLTTVKPPGGAEGALSFTSYQGFNGGDPSGQRITTKVFTDPVIPVAQASSTPGREGRVHLDELGRARLIEQELGADYSNQKMRVSRTYDSLGRLLFETDPYPSTQDATTAYGTTSHFNADGTPACFIRGSGKQPFTATTNEANELYPTCFVRVFQDNTEVVSVKDAASLLTGSPQAGVHMGTAYTATGRLLNRLTWQGTTQLERANFAYDRLGHVTSMTRYKSVPSESEWVRSSWRYDSLGQLLELDEPESPKQFNVYDNWGDLIETRRTVNGTLKRVVQRYDALGRLTHSEHQNGGVVDPETVHDYFYDTPVQVAPQVTAANTLGRLAHATWPTGSATLSYDGMGRTNAQVFTDAQGGLYVAKHTYHGDGSLDLLDLFLPDTAFANEQVKYTYDSAGRGKKVTYTKGSSRDLYQTSTIDPFGRVRNASYGPASYTANYADVGRRLMTSVAVSSQLGSRSISYSGFDPVGRERGRTEIKNGTGTGTTTTWAYDALGRLSSAINTSGTALNQAFTYDSLGNLLTVTNTGMPGAVNAALSYSTTDRDRICRIGFGADSGTACNVTYDELGSILSQPTPTGNRQYTYLVDGSVRTISDNRGSTATFRYDAFGDVQQLDLTSTASPDTREDRHFGALFTRRREATGGPTLPALVLNRKIPIFGSVATLHGAGGSWTFEFGERRGSRFFTDQTGAFVQDVDYDAFGRPTSFGAQPGSQLYSNNQWNGRDAPAAFGISQLGARLYDPAIGRFTSRDPLLIASTAATSNPYAFANNDPVNSSDPSGLCTQPGDDNKPCLQNETAVHTEYRPPTKVSDAITSLSPSSTINIGISSGRGPGIGGFGLSLTMIGTTPSQVAVASPLPASALADIAKYQATIQGATNVALQALATQEPSFAEQLSSASNGVDLVDGEGNKFGFPDPTLNLAASDVALTKQLAGPAMLLLGTTAVVGTGAVAVTAVATGAVSGTAVAAGAGATGVAARGVDRAAEGIARGGANVVRIGQAGEAAVRKVADIGRKIAIHVAGRTRIPDGLTNTVLSEVKNVRSLSFTQQLRDFATYASQNSLRFDLWVRPGARLSGPLLDARAAGRINILEIPLP